MSTPSFRVNRLTAVVDDLHQTLLGIETTLIHLHNDRNDTSEGAW